MHTPDLALSKVTSQLADGTYGHEPTVPRILSSRDEMKAFYDKIASVYDLLAEFSEQPMRQTGLKMLAAAQGETILEIGCGTGHCLTEISRAVGPDGLAIGLDISEGMLEETQKQFAAALPQLHCCDAATLPFADGTIDGIFSSFTLELFASLELPEVISEWKRVLRAGGRLVVVAISKEKHSGVAPQAFEWTHRHFPNLMDCRPIYVRRSLEAAGFRVVNSAIESMWVPVEIVCGVKRV